MVKVTVEVAGSELPAAVARAVPGGAIPGMRYRMTVVEIEEVHDEAAKLTALRADIAEAIADYEAGRHAPLDGQALLDILHRDHAPSGK